MSRSAVPYPAHSRASGNPGPGWTAIVVALDPRLRGDEQRMLPLHLHLSYSLVKQPSVIARIVCRGPGEACRLPLWKCEGDGAPSGATISPTPCGVDVPFAKARSPRGAPSAAFLSPGPRFRVQTAAEGHLIRAAFAALRPHPCSHLRQPVLVPADGCPGPPDPAVTSRSGGRRIPLRLQDRL
jgi:hypothetical protein